MGHAPSSECCNHEPFVVDFESKGKGHERLAAIALTRHNLTDLKSPFFQGLYAARSDESVRHWYCSTKDRSQINPAPKAEDVFKKFVQEATEYVEAAEAADPSEFTPLPIALIKLPQDAVIFHPENGQLLTTLELLGTNPTFEVVGYFGCRHFSAGAQLSQAGTIGMFLSKTFNNEAKSVAILEIACRCYKHYMNMYGMDHTPWPSEIHFDTLDSNMPCLRLMQKLLVSSQQQGISSEEEELVVTHDVAEERLRVVAKGSVVAKFAEHLAAQVTTADSITFSLKTRPVEPAPVSVVHSKLDEVITLAKKKWTEANRPVVEAYTAAKLARSSAAAETSSVVSTATKSSANPAPFPTALVAPAPVAPSTPTTTLVSAQGTTYRHAVYDFKVLDEKHQEEADLVQQCRTETAATVYGDHTTLYSQQQQATPVQQERQEVEEVSSLFLAKRTPISFWKKGRWSNAQWRDEAVVRLCAVQHAENDGLLAVELMYPNRNLPCPEISIFDEFNRPAKVRLDKPSIFYVPTNALYHRDLTTKQYIPFSVGTEIAVAQHQIESVQKPASHFVPQQQNSYSNNVYQHEQRHAAY